MILILFYGPDLVMMPWKTVSPSGCFLTTGKPPWVVSNSNLANVVTHSFVSIVTTGDDMTCLALNNSRLILINIKNVYSDMYISSTGERNIENMIYLNKNTTTHTKGCFKNLGFN